MGTFDFLITKWIFDTAFIKVVYSIVQSAEQ